MVRLHQRPVLQQLKSIINDLVTCPSTACHKNAVVDPTVPRIASLHRHLQPHLELISLDGCVFAELLKHLTLAGPGARSLQIDCCAIVCEQIVARVQMGCLSVAVVADDLPV